MANERVFRLEPDFADSRGEITNFLQLGKRGFHLKRVPAGVPDRAFVEVASITFARKGTVRGNHCHPQDQFVYILAGRLESCSVRVRRARGGTAGSTRPSRGGAVAAGRVERRVVRAGDILYTPGMVAHAERALEPTVMLNLNLRKRDRRHYKKGEDPHTVAFRVL